MIDMETANKIKARLHALREMKFDGSVPTAQFLKAEEEFRNELLPLGLVVLWIKEARDYGIFSNEGEV